MTATSVPSGVPPLKETECALSCGQLVPSTHARQVGPLRLTTNASIMVDVTRSYIDQHGGGRQDLYFAVTCHSKSVHPAVIEAFKLYHHRLSGIYGNRLKAITLQEVARNLEGKLEAG